MVIIKNATEIPPEQFLIKDSTTLTSELWFASKWQREVSFMQYSVPYKWPCDYLYSVKKITLVEYLKRHTWWSVHNNLRWYLIWLKSVIILCQPLRMVLTRQQNPVNHRRRDVWSTHQSVQDIHLGHSRELVEITHTFIKATRTRIQ
jgi:hypothetical protein